MEDDDLYPDMFNTIEEYNNAITDRYGDNLMRYRFDKHERKYILICNEYFNIYYKSVVDNISTDISYDKLLNDTVNERLQYFHVKNVIDNEIPKIISIYCFGNITTIRNLLSNSCADSIINELLLNDEYHIMEKHCWLLEYDFINSKYIIIHDVINIPNMVAIYIFDEEKNMLVKFEELLKIDIMSTIVCYHYHDDIFELTKYTSK